MGGREQDGARGAEIGDDRAVLVDGDWRGVEPAAVRGMPVRLRRPGRVERSPHQGQSLDETGADDDPLG